MSIYSPGAYHAADLLADALERRGETEVWRPRWGALDLPSETYQELAKTAMDWFTGFLLSIETMEGMAKAQQQHVALYQDDGGMGCYCGEWNSGPLEGDRSWDAYWLHVSGCITAWLDEEMRYA